MNYPQYSVFYIRYYDHSTLIILIWRHSFLACSGYDTWFKPPVSPVNVTSVSYALMYKMLSMLILWTYFKYMVDMDNR